GRAGATVRALLVVLAAVLAVAQSGRTDAEAAVAKSPQTYKFIAIPDMPACATAAILRGDPRSGPAWVLLKLGSGCRVPWHWHTANEDLVVISGRGTVSMKDGPPLQFAPGAYSHLPSHHPHQPNCSRECRLFKPPEEAYDV